ncbi:hypothetical protein WJX72_001287 [[Myrmecia] bisecta]|uniref:Replication factor A protein 3 n=1 Tax=[Myrmecia] bisecta TaxID=41462 RepID=A0AAW1PX60_9CHLO
MDTSDPAPRVNFELLQRYIGKKVRLVGKVMGLDGDLLTVKAADQGLVYVKVLPGAGHASEYVEIDGIVESPNTVQEQQHVEFGSNFDLNSYNELCKLAHFDYPALFL